MNIIELKQKIKEEGLMDQLLNIYDFKFYKFKDSTTAPYEVDLNKVSDNEYEIFVHDEKGFTIFERKNLNESEACECVLIALRNGTNELRNFRAAMEETVNSKKK